MALTRRELTNPNCEVTDSDYETIEFAIMELARGRWFLSEYARRRRHADTIMLLSAIDKLKEVIEANRKASHPYLVSTELSLAHLASQISRPPTPHRNLPALHNGAETSRNGNPKESDLRELMCSLEEADAFNFN